MFSRRQDFDGRYRTCTVLLASWLLRDLRYRGEHVEELCFRFLAACLFENLYTNDFARVNNVLKACGMTKRSVSVAPVTSKLIRLGLLERPSWGSYVVTSEGEYFLRDIETMFARITKNSARSKWRKILSSEDPRSRHVRKARVKGSIVVDNPIDDRLKLKRGVLPLKQNGQPRNINLPGAGNPI